MFQAIILGIVQGLTEFLPISSSGHLVLVKELLHFDSIDPAFDVFVQGGTVFSVLYYFRSRLFHLSRNYLKFLLIATIPAGVIGLILGSYIDAIFSSFWGVTLGFTLTTFVVLLSKKYSENPGSKAITDKSSFFIGLAQSAAILPGLSRSGSTITASLALGLTPLEAFNFSFLLSIPTIAGAALLSIKSITWSPEMTLAYLVGFLTAAVTGYYSLRFLALLMKKGRFHLFAPYTAALAVLSLILALS